ncbi:hypothetical protein [Parasitella parasitica]|uniref:Uncharacterized protein n=1 Tax=Parasitella parasitica TaxID=35722 RepID=A0A0B7N283_9FUNG|nr:hypothetical protein [Parasitella parasitica]
MNNQNTASPTTKRPIRTPVSAYRALNQDVAQLKEMFAEFKKDAEFNRACLMSLIKQLSPVFLTLDTFDNEIFSGVRKEIVALNEARNVAPATIVNPNQHGSRDIDFLLPIRIQGLINLLLKNSVSIEERNYTLESPMVQEIYRAMKKIVLPFHTAFMKEYWETQGVDTSGVLPNWSDIDATLKLKHFLLLESHMRSYGHILYRCKNNWASDRLFYQAHKSRRDRSLVRGRGPSGSSGSSSSSFSIGSDTVDNVSSGDDDDNEDGNAVCLESHTLSDSTTH